MREVGSHTFDWGSIGERFAKLRNTVDRFEIMDDHEFRRSVIPPVPSKENLRFPTKLDYSHSIYPSKYEERELLERIAWEFGFGPRWPIEKHLGGHEKPLVQRIEIAIRNQDASQQFIEDWAELHLLCGLYSGLLDRLPSIEAMLRSKISGWSETTVPQQQWYAFWLEASAPKMRRPQRQRAEADLAALCFDICCGVLSPYEDFPVSWFERMLEVEDVDGKPVPGPNLKSTYRELSITNLHAMIRQPTLDRENLPPLNRRDFTRT